MKLIARQEGAVVSKTEIRGEIAYIGRSKQNDLVLANPKISRRHAKIHFEDGQWFLEDLRSDNGTRFRGDRVLKINIRSGDRFSIGPFEIELEADLGARNEQATLTSYIEPSRYRIEEKPAEPPAAVAREATAPARAPETPVRPVPPAEYREENGLHPDVPQGSESGSPFEKLTPNPTPKVSGPGGVREPPITLNSGNFLDAIAVTPTAEEKRAREKADSLKAFIEGHSRDRLEDAPASESIHTVVIEPDAASLPLIAPGDDSVKTIIEHRAEGRSLARLVCLDQEQLGVEIEIKKNEVTFGNDERSDIRISSEDVPTRKAVLKSTDSTFVIETQESDSGTYVDGVPVRRRELENHDIIQVGESRFEFLLGDSKSEVRKARVIERPSKAGPWSAVEERLSDWRVLLASGAMLGIVGILALKFFSSLGLGGAPRGATPPARSEETTRVVLYHLTEAQRLIDEDKLDEAEVRVKIILGKVSPDDIDALKLLRKIQNVREERRDQSKRQDQDRQRRQSEVEDLLAAHNKLLEQKRFGEARKMQEKIVALEGDRDKNAAAAKTLKATADQAERAAVAEKKNRGELNKIYFQGVEEYENGNLGQAETLLREVAQKNGHPYQSHAKKLLAAIEKQLGGSIAEELRAARGKLKGTDALDGYESIAALAKKYPARKDVKAALVEAKKQMDVKAKEAYRQGLTMKEMAEDPAGAIDQFEKVLRYVPDPSHEYHKKAKEQIQKLQLNP